MAIPSINGQEINSGNAYQFYYGICHGKYPGIDENSEQAKWCQNFLSQDQITYCEKEDSDYKEDGAKEIDIENANENKDVNNDNTVGAGIGGSALAMGGGAVGAVAGNSASLASGASSSLSKMTDVGRLLGQGESPTGLSPDKLDKAAQKCEKAAGTSLTFNVVMSAVLVAFGALAIAMAAIFDPDLEARKKEKDTTDDNVTSINAKTELMKQHQESMEADAAEYEEQQAAILDMRTENTNTLAGIQIEMNDALAAGDKDKAAELEASMSELEAMEFDTGGMDDIKMRMNDYANTGLEADGLGESGTTVKGFLQEGRAMGTKGWIMAATDLLAGISAGIAAFKAVGSAHGIPVLVPLATASMILYGVAAAEFVAASVIMGVTASNENQCADEGDKYDDPLKNMISERGELDNKIGETNGGFEESDGAAEEAMVEVDKAAEGAVGENTGTTPGGTPVTTGGAPSGSAPSGGTTA